MDLSTVNDVSGVLKHFDEEQGKPNFNPTPILTRLCEIIEELTIDYYKMDPDPFDERHPCRADPECPFGMMLKSLFKKESFITKLVNDYMRDNYFRRNGVDGGDHVQLNTAACRLMLDILPGLDAEATFDVSEYDSMIQRLHKWATCSVEPLQTYATALLGVAMHMADLATNFKEENKRLIPIMLQRLRELKESDSNGDQCNNRKPAETNIKIEDRPFKHLNSSKNDSKCAQTNNNTCNYNKTKSLSSQDYHAKKSAHNSNKKRRIESNGVDKSFQSDNNLSIQNDTSSSSWAEMENYMIGTVQMYPLVRSTKQMFIFRYLTPLGQYQDFMTYIFEYNALELVLDCMNLREHKDARLAFEACRYLASILCHKKFTLEFIKADGLQRLLDIPRPSAAATGASMCLFYLAYSQDAMENICLFPTNIIKELVSYCLWLLECSHDSGRCHAVMFFALTFQFKMILNEFDAQDGLRKLNNTISTLPILSLEDDEESRSLNDEAQCAARQIVRHVCCALRKYFEAHLFLQAETLERFNDTRSENRLANCTQSSLKIIKTQFEEIQSKIEFLFESMSFRYIWTPVEDFHKFGGITLLLRVIALSSGWNFTGRMETLRSVLDILSICSIVPKVQLQLCEKLDRSSNTAATGINILLNAAENEIICDVEVQKAALNVLVNCVCAPIHRVGSISATQSSRNALNLTYTVSPAKKTKNRLLKSSEELIKTIWDNVRANSGIMVFISLLNTKVPITDADYIRTLSCQALVGLARSEPARQIISKLPLITSGELQMLMKDPILQEKRKEHVLFQKHALNLLEILSGRTKQKGSQSDISSLLNIHKSNVVAQTRIQFNEHQLYQLIHQHLVSKGLEETANALQKEAKLTSTLPVSKSDNLTPHTPFRITPALLSYYISSTPRTLALESLNTTPTSSTHHLSLSNLRDDQPHCSTSLIDNNSVISNSNNDGQPPTLSSDVKLIKRNTSNSSGVININRPRPITSESPFAKPINPPIFDTNFTQSKPIPECRITLNSIVVEYLMNQHALCKNPMGTCPQFNLLEPHKCPDPKPKITSSVNIVLRNTRRSLGYQSRNIDRKFIHSKFCPVSTIRMSNELEASYTKVAFLPNNHQVLIGDFSGKIHIYNTLTNTEELSNNSFETYIVNFQVNKAGNLILASQSWGDQLSALFDLNLAMILGLQDNDYAEFGHNQNSIIGTKSEIANIFDIEKGVCTLTLNPTSSNQYTKNRATFDPTDNLVLSDGVLWDVNSAKEIHKFDKLNQTQSGVFHPNGLEIISNTEVWDLRTFHLLKTVPALNHSQVLFSPVNDVIYTIPSEEDPEDDSTLSTTFKTIDATDYSNISLIDIKKLIYDLAVNRFDTQIAIVENQGPNREEGVVRLYDVGRLRSEDDDEQDEEEDEDGSDRSGSLVDQDITSEESDDGLFEAQEWLDMDSEFDNYNSDDEDDDNEDGEEDDDDTYEEGDDDDDDDLWEDL